jgi:hypothetical protein
MGWDGMGSGGWVFLLFISDRVVLPVVLPLLPYVQCWSRNLEQDSDGARNVPGSRRYGSKGAGMTGP